MTVLPQLERELLAAQERSKRRRAKRLLGLPSRIHWLGYTSQTAAPAARPWLSSLRRSRPRLNAGMVTLVASIAVTFGIAAVFLLNIRGPHAPTGPAARLPRTGQHLEGSGIDRALVRDFRILRRPLRPSDRLTGVLTQIAMPDAPISGDSRPASLGLLPRLAREQNLPGTRFSGWLIPGRHGLCWAAEYRAQVLGAFCSSFQNPEQTLAAADGDASVKTTTGLITIGLVTDRVLALELIGPHGQRKPVPISDGFYIVDGAGNNLIATTATGAQILPGASSELVLNTVGSRDTSVTGPDQQGRLLSQIHLRSPSGGRTPRGIAQIYKTAHGYALSLAAAGMGPTVAPNAYAVWLYSAPHAARLLGFITQRLARAGTVTTGGVLASNAATYRQILVTLETQTRPTTPGKIILNGPLRVPSPQHR